MTSSNVATARPDIIARTRSFIATAICASRSAPAVIAIAARLRSSALSDDARITKTASSSARTEVSAPVPSVMASRVLAQPSLIPIRIMYNQSPATTVMSASTGVQTNIRRARNAANTFAPSGPTSRNAGIRKLTMKKIDPAQKMPVMICSTRRASNMNWISSAGG